MFGLRKQNSFCEDNDFLIKEYSYKVYFTLNRIALKDIYAMIAFFYTSIFCLR